MLRKPPQTFASHAPTRPPLITLFSELSESEHNKAYLDLPEGRRVSGRFLKADNSITHATISLVAITEGGAEEESEEEDVDNKGGIQTFSTSLDFISKELDASPTKYLEAESQSPSPLTQITELPEPPRLPLSSPILTSTFPDTSHPNLTQDNKDSPSPLKRSLNPHRAADISAYLKKYKEAKKKGEEADKEIEWEPLKSFCDSDIVTLKPSASLLPPPRGIITKRTEFEYFHKIKRELALASADQNFELYPQDPMPQNYSQRVEINPQEKIYSPKIINKGDCRIDIIRLMNIRFCTETEFLGVKKTALEADLAIKDSSFYNRKAPEINIKRVTFTDENQEERVENYSTEGGYLTTISCYLFKIFSPRISVNKLGQLAQNLEECELTPPFWYLGSIKLLSLLINPFNGPMKDCNHQEVYEFVGFIMSRHGIIYSYVNWDDLDNPAISKDIRQKISWEEFMKIFDLVIRERQELKEVPEGELEEVIREIEWAEEVDRRSPLHKFSELTKRHKLPDSPSEYKSEHKEALEALGASDALETE